MSCMHDAYHVHMNAKVCGLRNIMACMQAREESFPLYIPVGLDVLISYFVIVSSVAGFPLLLFESLGDPFH